MFGLIFQFIRFITTFIIVSFSAGLLPAIIKVKATKVLFSILLELSSLYRKLFFAKYHTNSQAAIRLLPSVNEWFFTTKYKRFAAFSSRLGYSSFPSKVWSITAMELLKD